MITIQFAVIFFVVSIGLFFALRSLNIWYLKINVILKNQEQQKEMLRKLLEVNNIKTDVAPITQNTTQKPPVDNVAVAIFVTLCIFIVAGVCISFI